MATSYANPPSSCHRKCLCHFLTFACHGAETSLRKQTFQFATRQRRHINNGDERETPVPNGARHCISRACSALISSRDMAPRISGRFSRSSYRTDTCGYTDIHTHGHGETDGRR